MNSSIHKKQAKDLADTIEKFTAQIGFSISEGVEGSSSLLLHWLQYLSSYQLTGTADELIAATVSACREVAAALSIGLVSSSLLGMRCQIDLILAWLFYKDHPIEWQKVNATGDGFKLKKELLKYLEDNFEGSTARLSLLKAIAKRQQSDPYRLLSAHIHGQNRAVLKDISELKDVIGTADQCKDCVKLVNDVSEYLNDVLLAIFAPSWHSLPEPVKIAALSRFVTPAQQAEFFK